MRAMTKDEKIKVLEGLLLHLDEAAAEYRDLITNSTSDIQRRDWQVDLDNIRGARTYANAYLHDVMRDERT